MHDSRADAEKKKTMKAHSNRFDNEAPEVVVVHENGRMISSSLCARLSGWMFSRCVYSLVIKTMVYK